MKKIVTLLFTLLLTAINVYAQKLSWQAVVRDNDNKLVSNQNVTVEASVLSAADVTVFSERHNSTTNINGMLSLTIGDGTLLSGSLGAVDWVGAKIKTIITWQGGSVTNISPVNAVPYALYAASAGNSVSQVNADWNATSGVAAIYNKPHIFTTDELQALLEQYLADSNYVRTNNCQNINYCDLLQRIADLEDEIQQLKNQGSNNNNNDTSSTAPKPCPEAPTVEDIDGNVYQTVKVGNQCWMKTNLRTTRFNDGTAITNNTNVDYSTGVIPVYHIDDTLSAVTYGYYYNGEAATNSRGLCPTGWHVPTDDEWTTLTNYVKGNIDFLCNQNSNNTAIALASKESWENNNITNECYPGYAPENNNITGFSAIAAGYLYMGYLDNYHKNDYAIFWSCTRVRDSLDNIRVRLISNYSEQVIKTRYYYSNLLSVRCIRGETGGTGGEGNSGNNNSNFLIDTTETSTSCPGMSTVTDNEGNMYQTVKIGTQCWMKSNLRTKHYNDGTEISSDVNNNNYYCDDVTADPVTSGLYYSGYVVNDNRGICPQGWHIPTVDEYKTLIGYIKNQADCMCALNTNSTSVSLIIKRNWKSSDIPCTPGYYYTKDDDFVNKTGFSAIPAGYYSQSNQTDSYFSSMFWTIVDSTNAIYKNMFVIDADKKEPRITRFFKQNALSVRCLRDAEISGESGSNVPYSSIIDSASCPNTPVAIDIDDNIYQTVQIGNQCWLRSNLRTTRFSDGSNISLGKEEGQDCISSDSPYYYESPLWYAKHSVPSVKIGLFYNSAAANTLSRRICPSGWRVPSVEDFEEMLNFVNLQDEYKCNLSSNESTIGKSFAHASGSYFGYFDWVYNENNYDDCLIGSQTGEYNKTNFSVIPAGSFDVYDCFSIDENKYAAFWSTTIPYTFLMQSEDKNPQIGLAPSRNGLSIRCIKE